MPITALVADEPLDEWPEPMAVHDAQPWIVHHIHTLFMFWTEPRLVLGWQKLTESSFHEVFVYC